MIAYYVYDEKKEKDLVILPEMGCAVAVDEKVMADFIGATPMFAAWSGDTCQIVAPEDFGLVIATREDQGDVCVLKMDLWQERMVHYLGEVKPEYEMDQD